MSGKEDFCKTLLRWLAWMNDDAINQDRNSWEKKWGNWICVELEFSYNTS